MTSICRQNRLMANLIWYSSPLLPLIFVMYKYFNFAWAILVKGSVCLPVHVCGEQHVGDEIRIRKMRQERKRKEGGGRERKRYE